MSVGLTIASEIATLLGVPIAATNVGFTFHKALQSIRPYSKLKKWTIRIQQIAAAVASDGDLITREELEDFLRALAIYVAARDSFHQIIKDGTCTWFGRGKEHAEDFSLCARDAWYSGNYLSTEASARKLLRLRDNAQTSAAQEPATSTATSQLNKGKFREECSLSKESPLKNGPHSKKFYDTAKLSQPSTLASSGSYLPNEPQTSSILRDPPLYSESEGENESAINVSLEDETGDDSNNIALEEVQAVYNFWRQIPEEQCPWASTASLLDKLKLRGLITRQNPQQ